MYLPTDIIRTGESLIINNMEVTFMYCKNCGNEMKTGAAVCLECGMGKNGGSKYCGHCGSEMPENARVCII